jgi:hypothetical protein
VWRSGDVGGLFEFDDFADGFGSGRLELNFGGTVASECADGGGHFF